jgi:hypothetical protein
MKYKLSSTPEGGRNLLRVSLPYVPMLIGICWAAWLVGVLLHGWGISIWGGLSPNFVSSGQFGDSFGPLASLMAALAATGAFMTLSQQQEQSEFTENLAERQRFETTLFHLFDVVSRRSQEVRKMKPLTTVTGVNNIEVHGAEAFEVILFDCSRQAREADWDVANSYSNTFDAEEASLGHYFRIVYHVILFIHQERAISLADKYRYVRFLRAQLSNPELILILLNCLYGAGRQSFLPLAGYYDLFQNVAESTYPILEHLSEPLPSPPDEVQAIQRQLRELSGQIQLVN